MPTKNKVVIFGLGDFARVAMVYLESDSPYEVVAFTANQQYVKDPKLRGKPVVAFEGIEQSYPAEDHSLFVAIGFKNVNKARAQIYDTCKAKGYDLISYISSKAICSAETTIGDNCFILENTVIQPFVTIGNDVVIWGGSFIAHDSSIGDHCFIAPSVAISGNVKVGAYTFIGINATVRDGVTIAPGCIIGAGATILKDTLSDHIYAARKTQATIIPEVKPRGF
jgi:sugar O-acyltransferase (sialic acid O-acetyltransferase NeuD family)